MTHHLLSSLDQWEQVLQEEETFYVLKHSLTCPISGAAHEQYESFKKDSDIPCYTLYVQEARDVSAHIAEQTGVKHESPQVLLFRNKEVIYHDSHMAITKEKLLENTQ